MTEPSDPTVQAIAAAASGRTDREIVAAKTFALFPSPDPADRESLPALCERFHGNQRKTWPDLAQTYDGLSALPERRIDCGAFTVHVQLNPRRVASIAARLDEKTLRKRPCFLCLNHLPEAQRAVLYREAYLVLCNPAPLFPRHYTLVSRRHRPQAIVPAIHDLLRIARDASSHWTVFYNGPRCGASAPDHHHFQAYPSGLVPIEREWAAGEGLRREKTRLGVTVGQWCDRGRAIVFLKGGDEKALATVFQEMVKRMARVLGDGGSEPMLNLLCRHDGNSWILWVFPRIAFRPAIFSAPPAEALWVSPATVEMAGLLVVARERDFERLDASLIRRIYTEVSGADQAAAAILTGL